MSTVGGGLGDRSNKPESQTAVLAEIIRRRGRCRFEAHIATNFHSSLRESHSSRLAAFVLRQPEEPRAVLVDSVLVEKAQKTLPMVSGCCRLWLLALR